MTSPAAIATVWPCWASRSTDRTGQAAVPEQRGAADRLHAKDLVDDVAGVVGRNRAQPGVAYPLQRVEVGLGVDGRCHAEPLSQSLQPVQPVDGDTLPGPGGGGGVDPVGGVSLTT